MDKHILVIEDDTMQRKMLATLINRKLPYTAVTAIHGKDALQKLAEDTNGTISLAIMDFDMPVMDGMETLKYLKQSHPHLPVIMLTGSTDIKIAVNAMKEGAEDFIAKPYQAERIITTVRNILKANTLQKEVVRLKKEQAHSTAFDDLIGHDGGLKQYVEIGRKIAKSDIPALITGPTGSGKEVFSRAIHDESLRADAPFIAVNCGAIPNQLVESTLFGHEKGAFTGATEKAVGKFREADGGTIFLDEVGELPLETQVKLLRVLQQKEVEAVGAAKPIPVNVRVISATHRDLAKEVEAGNFRQDLYFRLNVLELKLPALQSRKQDIIPLAEYFIERFCAGEGRIPPRLSDKTIEHLTNQPWKGNVRELENTINRALVLGNDTQLGINDFLTTGTEMHPKTPPPSAQITTEDTAPKISLLHDGHERFKTIEEVETETMQGALMYFDGNITKASQAINMAKSTFYRKMKEYGIENR